MFILFCYLNNIKLFECYWRFYYHNNNIVVLFFVDDEDIIIIDNALLKNKYYLNLWNHRGLTINNFKI